MPAKNGFGLNDDERLLPVRPGSRQKQPEESIRLPKSRTPVLSMKNRKLLPEGEVFECQFRLHPEGGQDQGEQSQNRKHHGPEVSAFNARKVNFINEVGVLAEAQPAAAVRLCRTSSWFSAQCFDYGFRIARSYTQESQCWPFWCTPALFPVPKRRHAHADHQREFRLRSAEGRPDGLHIRRTKRGRPESPSASTPDLPNLSHAGEKFPKGNVLHLNSS